jgi:hypothetical protein
VKNEKVQWLGSRATLKMTDEAGVASAILTAVSCTADAMLAAVALVGQAIIVQRSVPLMSVPGKATGFSVKDVDDDGVHILEVRLTIEGPRALGDFVGLRIGVEAAQQTLGQEPR